MILFDGGMGGSPVPAPVNTSGNREKEIDIPRKVLLLDQRVVYICSDGERAQRTSGVLQ